MKKIKRAMAIALMILTAVFMFSVAASADGTITAVVRIEGDESNIYYDKVEYEADGKDVTVADILSSIDSVKITGAEAGFITDVDGIKGGKYGGYDGWYYLVNGETPMVGVNDFKVNDGDSIVLYYGGFPCQIPYMVKDRVSDDYILKFMSKDTEYDKNWNPTVVENPVVGAEVTIGDKKFTTDDKGEISIGPDGYPIIGIEESIQIEKKDQTGAPAVLRFAPDYKESFTFVGQAVSTEIDNQSDTDSSAQSDTDISNSSNTSSSSSSSSNSSSSSSSQSSSSTSSSSSQASSNSGGNTGTDGTAKTTTATTTITTTAVPSAVTTDTSATGDGRIYMAVGVLAAAVIVAVLMIVFKKKDND